MGYYGNSFPPVTRTRRQSRRGGMLKFVRSCGKMKNKSGIIRNFTAEKRRRVRAKHLQNQHLNIKNFMKRNRFLLLMVLLLTAATGAWAQSTTTTTKTYKVKMKDGTKDAEHWTISDGTTTKTG